MSDYMGWPNRETWNVWINIQLNPNACQYYKECLDRFINTGDNRSELIACLETVIENDHRNKIKPLDGVILDLVMYSFYKVHWYEIATSMVDEALKPMERIKLM